MGTTKENLAAAFSGESQARNKYTYWAGVAHKEGYHYIGKIFEETAMNEMRHAKDEFILLGGIGDTAANLQAALEGETFETETMYPEFAAAAEAEGCPEAASLFRQIAKVEQHHADRYAALLKRVQDGTVFTREEPIEWKCAVCGYVVTNTTPPEKCPCCKHPKEHYEPSDLSIV